MRPFQQSNYFLNAIHYAGYAAWGVGIWWLQQGISLWWLLLTFVMHNVIVLGASVGYHRLHTHRSFTCSRFWQVVLSVAGAPAGTGSELQWRILHTMHHIHSDKPGDPHYTGWQFLFYKTYNYVPLNKWLAKKVTGDPFLMFMHNYYVLVVIGMGLIALSISPLVLIFGYLMPIGTVGLFGALHQVISHKGGKARQLWFLEFIFPFAGEWLHAQHHANSKNWNHSTRWYHFDPGALLIKAIKQ